MLKDDGKLFGNVDSVVVGVGGSGGFTVVFFNVLCYNKAGVEELSDVGNVIVLSQINPKKSSSHERKGTPYYTHPFRCSC